MEIKLVTCASCGQQMPANAWSCPHCGDLNADAEAHEFLYLAREGDTGPSQPYFDTPMAPGLFSTPMRPWRFDSEQGASEAGEAVGEAPASVEMVAAPPMSQTVSPDVGRSKAAASVAQIRQQSQASPRELRHYQQPTQQPSQRRYDEVTRMRPQDTAYQRPATNNERGLPQYQYKYPWSVNRPVPRQGYLYWLELLGYVGLLGAGHITAGYTKRGFSLLLGWWAWFLMSKMLSIAWQGALDGFTFAIGLIVPIFSMIWLAIDLQKAQGRR